MTALKESLLWLEHEIQTMKYGSVALTVTVHAGELKRVEKTVSIKEQLEAK